MYSISAKVWLSLGALLVFLSSCSREGPEPLWEAQSLFGKEYKGGLFPVYITLKEPVDNASSISWNSRYAYIAYRKQGMNSKERIIADTAFLYWETPPPVFMKFDSTKIKNDSADSWKIDTSYYYRDTIFAIVNNVESLPIIIEVKNILPRIKSLTVGGISQPGDSLLTIAANLGDNLEITLELEKPFKNPFNSAFHPVITMPSLMGKITLRSENEKTGNDSIFVYEWIVPNKVISDSSGYLKIEDSRGQGERLYKVHLVAYTEIGSVWVATKEELVKYSPTGIKVAKIADGNFNSISDISFNSNDFKLFVADESRNSFSIYNNYGKQLYKDTSLFKSPSGIAVDVEGKFIWVADAKDTSDILYRARLRRFALESDSLKSTSVDYDISGPIKGLSINQYESDFAWFAIPKRDTVGFTKIPDSLKFMPNTWNRPSMVTHDLINSGIIWVADSSRIVAIDTSGKILTKINGFGFVSSVSASNGNVWVSDILRGKVYLFKPYPYPQDANLTVDNARIKDNGFIAPISVSAYNADGGAWVIDRAAGMAVRLDSNGTRIASGTGLNLPILGKTLQIVE